MGGLSEVLAPFGASAFWVRTLWGARLATFSLLRVDRRLLASGCASCNFACHFPVDMGRLFRALFAISTLGPQDLRNLALG